MSRRRFLQAGAAGAVGVVLGRWAPPSLAAVTGPAAFAVSLNRGWRFGGQFVPGSDQPAFDDRAFERVTLPHTVTGLSWRNWDPGSWERRWIYRRRLDVPPQLSGLRMFLDFGAAITGVTPTLNGRGLDEHLGGYLPFTYEVTDHLMTRDSTLAVVLDSRFNLNVPPNRPPAATTSVDFWQPGGIYRDVSLRAVPQVYVADVFAKPVDVLTASRHVQVECTVDAAVVPEGTARLRVELLRDGRLVAAGSAPVPLDAPGRSTIELTLDRLGDVQLWRPDDPGLYDVVTTLTIGGSAVHDHRTRIGFREAHFASDGFFLNGDRVKLFGLNRHQFYPFAGGAMPARVQRRDAEILRRELNCNIVRCSHYPQSEAFLDACDELGLLVFEEAAGWGTFIGDEEWRGYVRRDVREMVVRDRNHPSIVVWGARLNEAGSSAAGVALFTETRDIAHALDDSRQTTGAMLGGASNMPDYEQDVFSLNDYGRDANGEATLRPPRSVDDKPYLVTEAVGTLSGPARFYRRTDPVADQQGQARAHALVHDVAASNDRYAGCIPWCGFDYPSGTGNQVEGVKTPGVVDLFREPKLGAAIYRSQVDPVVRPVIEPAFYWDFGPGMPDGPGARAMICSNCERLELFVDGEPYASVEPDRSRFAHLRYPPSFVDLVVDGTGRPELRIDGFVGDERALSRSFSSDTSGDVLSVAADDAELAGDGVDATRVMFRALDRFGAARPFVTGDVTIEVDGPATLVGDSPFAFEDTGGVGAVWIRSRPNQGGMVRVRALHERLGTGEVDILVRPVPPGEPAGDVDFATVARPGLVEPGGSTSVTATLTNIARSALTDVELTLTTPSGWSARARTPTAFAQVGPGQAVEAEWEVTAPSDVGPGQVELTARAGWQIGAERDSRSDVTTLAIPTTFGQALNNAGTSDDSDVDAADFDGVGNSYSRQTLAAKGLAPGAVVTHDDVTFRWPDAAAGVPDNVVAQGQIVRVSGTGTKLGFLGASSSGSITGTGTLHYQDGTTSTYEVTFDDWWFAPGPDNEVVAELPYVNSQGIGGRPRGQRDHAVRIFYTTVPIDSGKSVAAVTLPAGGSTGPGRITGMHLFDLAVGEP